MMGMGEKIPKRKKSPFGCLPIPFYDMEADCFPVSENAEKQARPTVIVGGTDHFSAVCDF